MRRWSLRQHVPGGRPPDLQLSARAGEVVRLWLTNTANTRVFNVRMPGRE